MYISILIFELKNITNNITEKSKIVEAKAWTRKYFKEDSEENKFFDLIIKGIKDNKLISKPIHTVNQELAEIEIIEPMIKVDKNKNL